MNDLIPTSKIYSVVWARCWKEEICVPHVGCRGVEACFRVIEELGTYYAEFTINGQGIRYNLASMCYPAYTIGIGRLEICTNDLSIDISGKHIRFNLIAKLCLGWRGFEKCFNLANEPIDISWLTSDELEEVLEGRKYITEKLPEKTYISVS